MARPILIWLVGRAFFRPPCLGFASSTPANVLFAKGNTSRVIWGNLRDRTSRAAWGSSSVEDEVQCAQFCRGGLRSFVIPRVKDRQTRANTGKSQAVQKQLPG